MRSHAGRTALALLLAFPGCYQIPPELSPDYIGSLAEPGWPPPEVYSLDPFHPANRLFQRLFVLGEHEEPALSCRRADLPFSPRESLGPIDRAEVQGLLEEIEKDLAGAAAVSDPVARSLLQSDLLLFLARMAASGQAAPELRVDLAAAALVLAGEPPLAADGLPVLLKEPGWSESPGPRAAGFRPSLADLRWTRTFRRGGGREAALVRLRIGADREGEPLLLEEGSEAWLLTASESGPPRPAVLQLRRARAIRGVDGWEPVEDEKVLIRNPDDPGRPPLAGRLEPLCGSCHPGPGLEASRPPAAVPAGAGEPAPPSAPAAPATKDDQREDARRALREALGLK
jgi:hypothetical protein